MREKRELEERLRKTLREAGTEDEQSTQAAGDREEDSHQTSLTSLDTSDQGLEKSIAAAEVDHLKADKASVEENLKQKVDEYSNEIAELKTDIDELTTAIESKIHIIDELNAKVVRLSGEISHKDSELHERIPALLEKINSLSASIDMKMEENSLFAKELFELNVNLSTLNERIIDKDELLIDISADYKKQKEEIEALHGAHELTLRNLVHERDLLKQESEDLRNSAEIPLQQLKNEKQEKIALEDKLSGALKAKHELSRENAKLAAMISEKDTVINDLQRDVLLMGSKVDAVASERAESFAALQEQFSAVSQQLLEKNEMLNALTVERSQTAEKDQAVASLQKELLLHQTQLEEAAAGYASQLTALQEKISLLNQQLLEKQELLTVMASEHEHEKNDLLCQTDLLRKEKTHRDEEMNRLIVTVLEQEKKLAEHISLLDVSQKEKDDLREDLEQAAEKINELVLVQDHLASLSARQEESLSDARTEINLLQASHTELEKKLAEKQEMSGLASAGNEEFQKTTLEYQTTFEHLKQEIISLNKNLAEREQTINLLLTEKDGLAGNISDQQEKLGQYFTAMSNLERQLNESRLENNRLSAEKSDLANTVAGLQGEVSSLNRTREEEIKALKDDLLSYEHLKQEIILLNKNLAEKEQAINLLLREKDVLALDRSVQQEKLVQYSAAMRNLERQQDESGQDKNRLSAENSSLANTIARLQDEISALNLAREEKGKALKDDLSSYGRAVADLQLRLEQSLHENAELRANLKAAQSAVQEAPKPVIEKKEEPLRVREKGPAINKRSLAYALLALFLIAGIGVSFYAYNTGLIILPMQKPEVMKEVKKELAYNDMFSLLTKVSVSDDLKFQATLLTESLVLKSDIPGEKVLFDFQNHLYFKISISAPTKGLDAQMVDDPYPMITLTAGGDTVKPLSHIRVKEIKTFYRKEEPVSLMFYCAFPKTALTPDSKTLSLSLKNEKAKADIAWDLNSLRVSNLFP